MCAGCGIPNYLLKAEAYRLVLKNHVVIHQLDCAMRNGSICNCSPSFIETPTGDIVIHSFPAEKEMEPIQQYLDIRHENERIEQYLRTYENL